MINDPTPMRTAPPDLSYPGLSPQLLARVTQMWSARGLDFETSWRLAVRSLPGFQAIPRTEPAENSAEVDQFFLFDQCIIWVQAIQRAAEQGVQAAIPGLDPAQWRGLSAVAARLIEQLTALRMLALNGLPMPAMQIARSISEDVDMALVLLVRRKLAERFVNCQNVDEANEFWRRHIAGGRAFRTITEKLYSVGLDYSADSEYAQWRKQVLTVLGTAVHSSFVGRTPDQIPGGRGLQAQDSLYFSTLRVHELCAYAHLVQPQFQPALEQASQTLTAQSHMTTALTRLAAPLGPVMIDQMQSLTQTGRTAPPPSAALH